MLTVEEEKEFRKLLKRIGRNIRKVRMNSQEKQSDMSERIGINLKSYQRLEYGDFAISTRNLFRIANRMGVSVEQLVS